MTEETNKAHLALIEGAKKINEDDLHKIIGKQSEIDEKFNPDGPLGKYLFDIELYLRSRIRAAEESVPRMHWPKTSATRSR